MGTKRALAPLVREVITDIGLRGKRVADLFSGMGSVASALAPDFPVVTNDTLTFTSTFARARFLNQDRDGSAELVRRLVPAFIEGRDALREEYSDWIAQERDVLARDATDLQSYIASASHVGNSSALANRAVEASALSEPYDYCLTTIYFSAGYFSTVQAIDLDALRYAIDQLDPTPNRDWLLSAWISTAALLVNSPGHSAQFLKPTSDEMAERIGRQWARSVWSTLVEQLEAIPPIGDRAWRSKNRVTTEDALVLVQTDALEDVAAVYADPPYTADQYSRYYHLHETLYRYDFPASTGTGRYRDHRFHTGFSVLGQVEEAFESLVSNLARSRKTLILSYPADGLLTEAGVSLPKLLSKHFTITRQLEVNTSHSTMGASSGKQKKAAKERLYVCVP